MRIAMIGAKGLPHPGGIECVVEQLGSRLAARGHTVTAYVRPHYTPESCSEYRGITLVNLRSVPTKHLDATTHALSATAHILANGTDIAHIHSIGLSPFAIPFRLARIPSVLQSHGLDWQRKKWGLVAKTYLRATDYGAVYFPDVTTVVSRTMQAYYEQSLGRSVAYIPNGVDRCLAAPPNEILKLGLQGNDYILFAARIVPEKGLHYLIEAFSQISNPRKKLVIAGDSNYRDQYATALKKYASSDIQFLGFATGLLFRELLSNAYLYVLPSEIEGLSTGLLEAMNYGNCVLVSDIDENKEVVCDAGFYFRTKDVADLKSKLELLLERDDLVQKYRTEARSRVAERYNWDTITDEYEALYSALIQR